MVTNAFNYNSFLFFLICCYKSHHFLYSDWHLLFWIMLWLGKCQAVFIMQQFYNEPCFYLFQTLWFILDLVFTCFKTMVYSGPHFYLFQTHGLFSWRRLMYILYCSFQIGTTYLKHGRSLSYECSIPKSVHMLNLYASQNN